MLLRSFSPLFFFSLHIFSESVIIYGAAFIFALFLFYVNFILLSHCYVSRRFFLRLRCAPDVAERLCATLPLETFVRCNRICVEARAKLFWQQLFDSISNFPALALCRRRMGLCMSSHNARKHMCVCVCVCWRMGTRFAHHLIESIFISPIIFISRWKSISRNIAPNNWIDFSSPIRVCGDETVRVLVVLKYWKAIWVERARSSSAKSQVHLGEQPFRKFKNISQSNRYIYCRLLRHQTRNETNRFEKNPEKVSCFSFISRIRWITVACVHHTCAFSCV